MSRPMNEWYMSLLKLAKNIRLQSLFLIIFLTFGLVMIWLIPPGWNTDETNHSFRIYQLSNGNLFSEKVTDPQTGLKAYGGEVPNSLLELYKKTGALEPGVFNDITKKVNPPTIGQKTGLLSINKGDGTTPINFSGAALYSPISYLPYIPIFWVGQLLGISYFWIIIICKIVGLILVALSFYGAIKYIPIGKWIIFAVGLIPTVIVQSTTVGADAPQLAVSILFITLVTRLLIAPKKPNPWAYALLTFLSASLVLIKLAYAPLLLLLLAIPLIRKDHRDKRNMLWLLATLIVSIIPALIWTKLVSYVDINSNPQADFVAQKAFIYDHPLTFMRTLYYTFFTNSQTSLANMLGSFIWDSVALPAIYGYAALSALVVSVFVKNRDETGLAKFGIQQKRVWQATMLLASFSTVMMIAVALYIYSTTLHQSSIVGIQSRYFIPLLPIVLLVFYGNFVSNQRSAKIGIVVLSCLSLVGASLAIYMRLYQSISLIVT